MRNLNWPAILIGDYSDIENHEWREALVRLAQRQADMAAKMPAAAGEQPTTRRARAPEPDHILRIDTVMRTSGLSYATLWRRERAGTFPKRRKISKCAVGWLESEVKAWLAGTWMLAS